MPHSVPIEVEQSATHCRYRLTDSTLNLKSSGPTETPAPTDKHKRRHDSVENKLKIHLYDNLKFKHYKSGMHKIYRYLGANSELWGS